MVAKLTRKSLGAQHKEEGIRKTQDVLAVPVSVSYVNTNNKEMKSRLGVVCQHKQQRNGQNSVE